MKIKTAFFISSVIISTTFFVQALETKNSTSTTNTAYVECKNSAQKRRDQTMLPALKEYVLNSTEITNKAKSDFNKARWLISRSYREEARRIHTEKKDAMNPVNEKVAKVRATAENTLKAELALCEMQYNKVAPTSTKNTKKK